MSKKLPAGLSKITIKAKVKGQDLKPDTYVITGTATNATGNSPKKKAKLRWSDDRTWIPLLPPRRRPNARPEV